MLYKGSWVTVLKVNFFRVLDFKKVKLFSVAKFNNKNILNILIAISSISFPGIYPKGVTNHDYVDFVYVGGTQNPLSEIITKGNVQLKMVSLPAGSYDVRYL